MKRLLVVFFACALGAGCVSSSDLDRLEDRIQDLQDEIADLKRQASTREEVERLNEELASRTQTILRSAADVTAKVDRIDERIENTQGSIEQTNHRIDRVVQQLTQHEREIANLRTTLRGQADPAGDQPLQDQIVISGDQGTADPIETYQRAYSDYQRGNFDFAIDGFREFVENNPLSDLADNAAYWIGESLFSQTKYREAVSQFDTVITQYPQSDKVAAALLKKGYAYFEIDQRPQGIIQLQYVIHEHPRSPEAVLAREKLESMGIQTR